MKGSYSCNCKSGFFLGENNVCQNRDECTEGTFSCPNLSECRDTTSGYDCICVSGFEASNKTSDLSCEDIDECSSNDHNCHEMAICTNNIGSFQCTCNEGYSGDGKA